MSGIAIGLLYVLFCTLSRTGLQSFLRGQQNYHYSGVSFGVSFVL